MPSLPEKQFRELIDRVVSKLGTEGWQVSQRRPIDYGLTLVLDGGGLVNMYNGKKGPKAVITGKVSSDERRQIDEVLSSFVVGAESSKGASQNATNRFDSKEPWIGCDESGKGDYFGPLVVASVLVSPDQLEAMDKAGLRDSKRVSDRKALEASAWIEKHCPVSLRVLMPEDYNQRYAGNLNTLLSELHAETIGELAQAHGARRAVSDQFGNPRLLRQHLAKYQLELISVPRAEQDVAVAAASIVARAHFLEGLRSLGTDATLDLLPGASAQVERRARELVKLFGPKELYRYAKLHFKTTQRVTS